MSQTLPSLRSQYASTSGVHTERSGACSWCLFLLFVVRRVDRQDCGDGHRPGSTANQYQESPCVSQLEPRQEPMPDSTVSGICQFSKWTKAVLEAGPRLLIRHAIVAEWEYTFTGSGSLLTLYRGRWRCAEISGRGAEESLRRDRSENSPFDANSGSGGFAQVNTVLPPDAESEQRETRMPTRDSTSTTLLAHTPTMASWTPVRQFETARALGDHRHTMCSSTEESTPPAQFSTGQARLAAATIAEAGKRASPAS
jgi:hypothetical protein